MHDFSQKPSPLEMLASEAQSRLAEILAAYADDLEQGRHPDIEAILAAHPDLAAPLQVHLVQIEQLHLALQDTDSPETTKVDGTEPRVRDLGDYRIERELGRGGMGVVYLALQVSLGRPVALKILPFASGLDQKQIDRFRNEARAAAQLHHPNIVPVYAVGCDEGVHYYAMQYVDGQALDTLAHPQVGAGEGETASWLEVSRGVSNRSLDDERNSVEAEPLEKPIEPAYSKLTPFGPSDSVEYARRIAQLGLQVAAALDHAHEYGIIHRDIKPSNLILDRQGKVWVTDFGLARFQANAQVTQTGDLVGTLRYMSPEQALGQSRVLDERTDIYSLGITLYELLAQRPAFRGYDRNQILHQIAQLDPTPIRRVNPSVPIDLETIVIKAISKSPQDRYTNCRALADDLRRFLAGEPCLARRPGVAERVSRWTRRHRGAVRFAAGLAIMAVLGLSLTTFLVTRAHQRLARASAEIQSVNFRLEEALADSERNRNEAARNFTRAQNHFRQARQVLDTFGTRYSEPLRTIAGAEPLRLAVLRDTLRYYQDFIKYADDDPVFQRDMAVTYSKVGTIHDQLGQRAESLAAYRKTETILNQLVAQRPDSKKHQADLALCQNNIGLLLSKLGKTVEAGQAYRSALDLQKGLHQNEPSSDRYQAELALTYNNRGLLSAQTGRIDEAQVAFGRAIELQRDLVRRNPERSEFLGSLAISLDNQSRLESRTNPLAAIDDCRRAIDLQKRLVQSNPEERKYRYDLALSYHNLGSLENRSGDLHAARDSYSQAIQLLSQLTHKAPSVATYRFQLAVTRNNLGQIQNTLGELDAARESFETAIDHLERFVEDHPNDPNYLSSLGGTLNNLGMTLERLDQNGQAVGVYRKAIGYQYRAMQIAPTMARFRLFLNKQYWNYARLLRKQNQFEEAGKVTLARKQLWADRPDQLIGVAGELAMTALLLEPKMERSDRKICQWLSDEAIETVGQAIDAGLNPREKITENRYLAVLLKDPRMRNLLQRFRLEKKTESSIQ